jgi:N-acetylglucosamine-6-phosphate deacetylase
MMTETPARILGIPAGRIAPGCPADLLAFDDGIQIRRIFIRGEDRSGVLTAPHTA